MADNNIAISVKNLHKTFRLPYEQHTGLKQFVLSVFQRKPVRGYENQHVLKGISFDVKRGDFFGVVGRNGSGKSTLLKLMSGIYMPDSGSIEVNGTLVPFIELGVGFNPELTGRENIFLNGALLGFSHDQMKDMYDEIVEFAELRRFMDQKLKNYSSGMQVRLAFSIAIRAKSDILILDEVLAVGDEAFQRKCFSYFAELKRNKKTVILVTHSMDSVQQFCNKALLIEKGKIVELGNPATVAGKYIELNEEGAVSRQSNKQSDSAENEYGIEADISMEIVRDKLQFSISATVQKAVSDAIVTFVMNRDTGEKVYRWATDDEDPGKASISLVNGDTLKVTLELDNIFPDGQYDVQLAIKKIDRSETFILINRILEFRLTNPVLEKRNTHWKPKSEATTQVIRIK